MCQHHLAYCCCFNGVCFTYQMSHPFRVSIILVNSFPGARKGGDPETRAQDGWGGCGVELPTSEIFWNWLLDWLHFSAVSRATL